ncbi:hypothetical protein MM0342_15020 [Helicobacter pylori]
MNVNKQVIKSLRLSKEQWQTIQTQMQEKNLNFSQLVLNSLLIQNPQSQKKTKKQKAIANKELVIELAKWGNNLNQIAHHLNLQVLLQQENKISTILSETSLKQIETQLISYAKETQFLKKVILSSLIRYKKIIPES